VFGRDQRRPMHFITADRLDSFMFVKVCICSPQISAYSRKENRTKRKVKCQTEAVRKRIPHQLSLRMG
jgi:hypothetical protein